MNTINPDNWIPLKNKDESKCSICKEKIEVGKEILWKKGAGIKHKSCEPVEKKPIVTEKEWKDFKQYTYKERHFISNCQCWGESLEKYTDLYINDDRRTCPDCFGI